MGTDILFFVDTDLHDLKPDDLHRALEKRIHKHIHLRGFDRSPYPPLSAGEEWSLYCYETNLEEAVSSMNLELLRRSKYYDFGLSYFNNTFEIGDLTIKGREFRIHDRRFNSFCRLLSENTEFVLKELKYCIDSVNKYLRPITHSTRLFLCPDQEYTDEKELLADVMMEQGLSIDQAIEYESQSIKPFPLYTWDNLDILMKDYIGWGIFDLSLDNLPDYISSIT